MAVKAIGDVGVLDQQGNTLANCTQERATILLERGHAVVISKSPYRIVLTRSTGNGAASTLPSGKSPSAREREIRVSRLLARDGTRCFYCDNELGQDITVEHLLSKADGGNNKYANIVLAHADCNNAAKDLAVVEKVKLREHMRSKRLPAA